MTHLLVLAKENEKRKKKGERLQKKECRVGFGPTFVYLLSNFISLGTSWEGLGGGEGNIFPIP